MWVLLVVFINYSNSNAAISMQEFSSQETCQAAGTKLWELSRQQARWSCVKQ